ncbi:hypothetical protein M408DRAFT_79117, partial [Serendipita vermifera MAFF 305830]
FTSRWYEAFGRTAIGVDICLLPVGVGGFIISQTTGRLPPYFTHKHILMFGSIITTIVTGFLPFGDAPNTYWPFAFQAFCIGTPGMVIVYSNSPITVFSYTSSSVAGIAAAVLNSFTRWKSSQRTCGRPRSNGRAAGFWFVLMVFGVLVVCAIVLFKMDTSKKRGRAGGKEKSGHWGVSGLGTSGDCSGM